MRKRFQNGSVKKSKDRRYWIGQWREDGPDGTRVERTKVLGKTSKMSKSEAREKIADCKTRQCTCGSGSEHPFDR
jgi:hypothetical protein